MVTLNEELQNRNQELTTLNDDQSNLFSSVNLPILMLDRDLRLRRFTPQAEKVLNLSSTDLGRPIGDIRLKIDCLDLEQLIIQVIDTLRVEEREIQDADGRWYLMRVRPYKTQDNRIEGAVVALVDIEALKRSEAEIREARDYSEGIVRTTREPLLILDADLRVHTANEAFYNTFKTSPLEAERRLIYELGNHQWNIPRLQELLEDILPHNSFFENFEVTHDFETIGRRTLLLNARRLSDTNGHPARILLGIQDTTEQLQFQAKLRGSEQRYRRLFEAARDGVLLVDFETRKIVDANPFMTELLGYPHAELVGKELFEIGLLKDEATSRAAFRELQERGFIRYEDLPLESNSGERREVEFVSNLYREDERQIIQCNIRDITERKRAEEVLRESEERYRTLFDLGPVAVYSCDTSGVIRDFNRRAAELWGREPALGETDERFCGSLKMFRPDDTFMPHEECPMAEVLSGKISETRDAEVSIERPDGSRITVIVNIRPLKNKQGEVTGAINCFYDITERKQGEEERARLLVREQQARQAAEAANRLKDEFLATLSHEMRNPLNSIVGYAEILVRSAEATQSPLIRQAAETIHRNASSQSQLIKDLLDLSRLQTGKLALKLRPLNIAQLISDAVESVEGQAEEKEIKLTLDFTDEPLVVNADAVRLQQIVWNLAANAVKFTPKGGRVSVTVGREGEEAVLRVEDTGQGIELKFLPHVFEMFRQAEASSTRTHGGMGIGLALVHQLAELHGGRVDAQSEGLGHGARFTVWFPLQTVSQIPHMTAIAPAVEGELRGARILVVDDTQDSLEMLSFLLKSEGAAVETAMSGEKGLRLAESSEFDLIFSDISMPDMDGYEFMRALRENPTYRTTPAIALTGFGREEDVEESRQAGFTTHLTKPLDYVTLVKLARVTLRK
jgi:PAS domain S-box-containing protein